MVQYPPYISHALDIMGPIDEDDIDAYLTAFVAAWGSLDPSSLFRALRGGDQFDRLFALFALAATHTDEAHEALVPYLASTQPLARLLSALELGEVYHDTRALSVLQTILREPAPSPSELPIVTLLDRPYSLVDLYASCRRWIPGLLGVYGGPESVPALRAELQTALQAELEMEALTHWPRLNIRYPNNEVVRRELSEWIDYEDRIVYELGRLGGFGALVGLEGAETQLTRASWSETDTNYPQSHLDQWRLHLIMGSLHGKYPIELKRGVWAWKSTPELWQAVTQQLEHMYGLEQTAYLPMLDRYALEMGFTLINIYHWPLRERGNVAELPPDSPEPD